MPEPVNHGSLDGSETFCGIEATPQNFRIGGVSCPDCMASLNGPTTGTIGTMPNKPKTPVSTFRLPLDLKAQAQVAAEANGTTLTAVVVAALEQYVKKNRKVN